jgi:hypothetical protein
MKVSLESHKGDFDYLLGDWEFTATSQQYGRFRGFWSAVRLDEGQVLDEYRVVGDGGQTYYVTTTLRNYNSAADRWELMGADAGAGLQDFGTAQRVGEEVRIEQRFGVAKGNPPPCGSGTTTSGRTVSPGRPTARTTTERRGSRTSSRSKPGASARRGSWGRWRPRESPPLRRGRRQE